MWIFGYGSLMHDRWENAFGCLQATRAELPGYSRVFKKKSTVNWGSPEAPGPTLNLVPALGSTCVGMAFLFEDGRAEEVLQALREREGKGFALTLLDITTPAGPAQAHAAL